MLKEIKQDQNNNKNVCIQKQEQTMTSVMK